MNEIKICRYKSPLSWISNLATLSTRILLLISGVQGPSKKASPSYQLGCCCCLFTRLLTAVQNGVFKLKYGEEWLHVAVSVVNIACCDCCDGGNIKNFIMKWRTRPQLAAVLTRTCAQPSRGLATSFSPGMFVSRLTADWLAAAGASVEQIDAHHRHNCAIPMGGYSDKKGQNLVGDHSDHC